MRLQSTNKYFYELKNIFRSKSISKNLKVRMCVTLLRPIVLYGTETWPLRRTEKLREKHLEYIKQINKKMKYKCKSQLCYYKWLTY